MSCFAGKLKEYPCFSVDCFDKHNLDSNVYFLSHCHQDHMNGLESAAFLNKLKSSQNVLVYCSETSRNILLCDSRYKHLEDYVVGLPIEHPTMINVKDELTGSTETICVTLLSAGHCIGSVMFLFEGSNGTVLYTGDFRLSKGDASRIPFFQAGDSIKEITSIYVDTTFCLPQMKHIPSREATKNSVLRLIKWWLKQGSNYYVSLLCKGMYGYEYLLKEVAIDLKTKIHVSHERLQLYRNLHDMTEHFTTDAKTTKIHSCNWEQKRHAHSNLPCGLTVPAPQQLKVMRIKASSMWFARRKEPIPADCVVKANKDFYRVVHSMHASMEEIFDLVAYLRPKHVYPTVEPAGLYTIKQAQESLKRLTRLAGYEDSNVNNSEETGFQDNSIVFDNKTQLEEIPALFNDQKSSKSLSITHSISLPSEEVLAQCKQLGLMDDTLASIPPRRRRRNQTLPKTLDSDGNKLKEKGEAAWESHPHKRRILQENETNNVVTSEVHINEEAERPANENNCQILKHLPGEELCSDVGVHREIDGSSKSPLKLVPNHSSKRMLGEHDSIFNPVQNRGLRTSSRESHVRIKKNDRCLLGNLKHTSDYCIPASPGNEQPSQELLGLMHKNLAQDEVLQVACLQDC